MKRPIASADSLFLMQQVLLCLSLVLALHAPAAADSAPAAPGERMYREGLLTNGAPLMGEVRGDVTIDSTMFSCMNCHSRGGLGAIEGQVVSPPINGASLFKPRYLYKEYIKNEISRRKGVSRTAAPLRPAYTEETLANAIRGGVDPAGRELLSVMPRYSLEDRDLKALIRHLQTLSAAYSPGATDTTLHLATIVTEDVSAEDRQALLIPLETMVTINQQTKTQRNLPQFAKMFRMLDSVYYRDISLAVWELKGAPRTWRAQLEKYNRKAPVFAILGGISGKPWQPIHDFCEERQIPCLFPITDLPVISKTSWYTFYASKGFYQEGETAARYLANELPLPPGKKVLQLVGPGQEAEALSRGFSEAWSEVGKGPLETVRPAPGRPLDAGGLLALLQTHQPAAVVFWSGPELVPVLQAASGEKEMPVMVVSARAFGKAIHDLPEGVRERTYITYPYRLPEEEKIFASYADILLLGKLRGKDEKRIASRAFSLVHLFLLGLKELRLDFYRDNLIDKLSMSPDQLLPDFERYSFGPGQRYASKGCYMVQLGKGPAAQLVRKSDWVVF